MAATISAIAAASNHYIRGGVCNITNSFSHLNCGISLMAPILQVTICGASLRIQRSCCILFWPKYAYTNSNEKDRYAKNCKGESKSIHLSS
ncbi:hypothetical protein CRG98_007425 [Punica granatum]|uniref:Uncharacterized protein n=1 Tax=Punica granatum TaxID=22663 RepID=A0A2I0KUT3_PUNGR|nr:hypothetical protein CRG98_007425 [Punica granatum]